MAAIMNKMVLVDQFGQVEEIQLGVGPVVVPRIGESVAWKYNPAPKVVNVQYDFRNGQIFVALN